MHSLEEHRIRGSYRRVNVEEKTLSAAARNIQFDNAIVAVYAQSILL